MRKSSNHTSLKKQGKFNEFLVRFRKSKGGVIGVGILVIYIIIAIFAEYLAPYDPLEMDLVNMLSTPSKAHLFGTDEFGRDILSRLMYGARISMSVGILSVFVSLTIGGGLGAIAGFYSERLDNIIMRITDVFLAIPPILLEIAIISALGPSVPVIIFCIAISYIPTHARIMRGSVITTKGEEYIDAAVVCGGSKRYILTHHVIPNAFAPSAVEATMQVGSGIISCAGLSFMGIGIQAPTPEWGAMLSSGRDLLRQSPHVTFFPGLVIMISVLSLNLIGDALRDSLDPRLR